MTKNNRFPDYICLSLTFTGEAPPDAFEMTMALLGEYPFESFEETDDGIKAYIPAKLYDTGWAFTWEWIDSVTLETLPGENWNAVWESGFEPVTIGNFYIRASFHTPKPSGIPFELIIDPQMAFGTGHHATTALCLEFMSAMNLHGKSVIDVGCGTGILAIAASVSGASEVLAIDNDPVCIENTGENCLKNQRNNIKIVIWQNNIVEKPVDLVIANIQRNVLLEQMAWYATHTVSGGLILLSGFRPEHEKDILVSARQVGCKAIRTQEESSWMAALLQKE